MATIQEKLAQIGLTPADIQEYKATGSFSKEAQAKINAYKAKNASISNNSNQNSATPATNLNTPTGNIGAIPGQVNTQSQQDLEKAIKSGNFTASQRAEYNRMMGNNNRARDLALTSKQGVGNLTTSVTPDEVILMKNAGITGSDIKKGTGHITADLEGGTKEEFKQQVQDLANTNTTNNNANNYNGGVISTNIHQNTNNPEGDITNTANPNGGVVNTTPKNTVTPKNTTTPANTATRKNTTITKDTPWSRTGKTINDLERIVQARYGNATLQGNAVVGKDGNGIPSIWTIGPDGNPHKEQHFQSTNDFLDVFISGGRKLIDPKYNNDPRYIEAKHIYDTLSRYKGASSDVLYSAMITNQLVPGSDVYNDLVKMSGGVETPEMLKAKAKYEQKMKTEAINRDMDITTGTDKPPVNPTETVSDNIVKNKGMDYAVEFQKDIVDNPEINSIVTDLNATTERIKELEQAKSKTLKKIIADHPGISIGMALGLAQNENNNIDEELQGLYNKQATLQANLSYKTELASKMFDLKVKQNEENMAEQRRLEDRAYQEQQKLEERAYQEQLLTKKLEQEYQYKYGDINSTNPLLRDIAIQNAVNDMFDRYKEIPGLESRAAKVQKVKDYMSGKITGKPMSGGEALARVENEIRSSSRYADYLANAKAKMTSNRTEFVTIGKDENGNDIKGFVDTVTKQVIPYNPGDISNIDLRNKANLYTNDAGVKNNNPAGLTFSDAFAKTLTNAGIQFSKGTARPEGGNYFSFPNIGEGLKAYNLLWDSESYANKTVGQALNRWGTGSLNLPGISKNTKIKNLTPEQKLQLQEAQIKKESPGMYQELSKLGYFNQKSTQADVGPIDARTGVPVTYARRIKSMIPTALQNSDLEAKNINKTIKSLYSQGVSAEDAVLYYMGIDVEHLKPNVKQIGLKMIDTLKGTDAPFGSYTAIADALNKGNTAGATQLLENTLYKQRGIHIDDINAIGNNIKNGQNLIDRINILRNKFGPISGRKNEWALKIQNDPEVQRAISDMANYIAKYRNGIAGTNVTGNEEKFLESIIPTIKDNPDNAIAKIQSNIMQSFNGLNTIRDNIGLPELQNPRSAYDINLRKQVFTGEGEKQSTGKTTNTSNANKQIYTSKSGKTYNINDYR